MDYFVCDECGKRLIDNKMNYYCDNCDQTVCDECSDKLMIKPCDRKCYKCGEKL